jgi:hypothetical protein
MDDVSTIDLTPLPDIHRVLIQHAVDALVEYALDEEPTNLDEAIRCLTVLRLYVTPAATETAP